MNFNNPIQKMPLGQKIIILILGNIAWIIAVIYIIILPQLDSIDDFGKRIKDHKIYIERQYEAKQSTLKNKQNIELIEKQMDKIDQMFISQNRELEFITTLESLADKYNLQQKISLEQTNTGNKDKNKDKSKIKSDYKKVMLNLNLEGSFSNIMNYLIDLEALNYYINISSLDLGSAEKISTRRYPPSPLAEENNQQDNNIVCKLTADTYWK